MASQRSGPSAAEAAHPLRPLKNAMLLDRSLFDLSGRTCDKIGVSYNAFRYQADGCSRTAGSCLFEQLADFHAEEHPCDAARPGQPRYMASGYCDGGMEMVNVDEGTSGMNIVLACPLAQRHTTLLRLEARAESAMFVTNVATGRIIKAEAPSFEALSGGGEAELSIINTGHSQGEGPCEASIRRGPSSFSISSLNDTEKSEKDRWAIQQKLILRKLDVQDQKLAQILDMMKRMAPKLSLTPLNRHEMLEVLLTERVVHPRRTPRLFTTSKQEEDMHRFKAASKDGANARRRFADLHIDAQSESQKSWSLRVVTHPGFDIFALVVLTNSAYIGVEVQYSMSQPSEAELLPFHIIGTFYTILFTAELIMRIWAYGVKSFFCDEDWAWSLLDFFIVATSLFELVSFILQVVSNISGSTNMSGISSLKAFRIIRLTRLLKTVRLMRIFRFVLALRMLVTSIFHTLKSLFWALVLLLLIVYVFAVLFVQAVQDYLEESRDLLDDLELRACELYFQSLGHTMITLFMSISGGVSWENALLPLMKMSPLWVGCFIFFVAFTYFAVLNVITAVFCESAIEKNHLQKVRNLFARLGANADSGSITFSMLESQINSPAVHEYFTSLGLDIWDAWTFFRLLDADGGGEVEVEEFLMGCLRLRGPATAIDMGKVLRDQNWVVQTLGRFSAYVEGELQHVKLMLEAERTSCSAGLDAGPAVQVSLKPLESSSQKIRLYASGDSSGAFDCNASLYDALGAVTDSVLLQVNVTSLQRDDGAQGGGNGGGDGNLPNATQGGTCATTCPSFIDVMCFLAHACWDRVGWLALAVILTLLALYFCCQALSCALSSTV
eukprot:g15209.t1